MSFTTRCAYPLLEALQEQLGVERYRFHVPAHTASGNFWSRYDLTELPGLDHLFAPRGSIARAQELAAAVFQADRTYFLVNGSSAGLAAAIAALCRAGQSIVLSRHCHRSVAAGLIVSGAKPLFLPAPEDEFGIPAGPTSAQVEAVLSGLTAAPAALLVTSPNYWGISCNLPAIADCARRAGIPLLVDEAHGGHFIFHEDMPTGAAPAGASLWVNSAHKTLGALTPGAYLHLRQNGTVDLDRLEAALALFQTSSPPYPVLLSLDLVRGRLHEQGREIFAEALHTARQARRQFDLLRRFCCLEQADLPADCSLDPLRLTVRWADAAINGFRLYNSLHQKHRVALEMAGARYLVAIIHPGAPEKAVPALINALQEAEKTAVSGPLSGITGPYPIPEQRMTPREAVDAPARRVSWREAAGAVSAQLVTPFPPGVPVLYPGEEISGELLERLAADLRQGVHFQDLEPAAPESIRVVSV
ncbi:MAG: aminotransferase class I/II-fold pyridoxal phosphate-dependent enzyme [Bacillota bacterium]